MEGYLKLYIEELEEAKQSLRWIGENLDDIESSLNKLLKEFGHEELGVTATRIEEIIEDYICEVKKCNDLVVDIKSRLDEYIDLTSDVLQSNTTSAVIVDLEEINWIKRELEKSLAQIELEQVVFSKIDRGIQLCDEDIAYLNRIVNSNSDELSSTEQSQIAGQLYDVYANKQTLVRLKKDLIKVIDFEDEQEQILRISQKLENLFEDIEQISLDECADMLEELKMSNRESIFKVQNLHALSKNKSEVMYIIFASLISNQQQGVIDQIKELKANGMFENFYYNVSKQVQLMGIENFLKDPNRIRWLAFNPQVQVGDFSSNLTPEQLRLLTEELPYVIFDEKITGEVVTNYRFYYALSKDNRNFTYNKRVKNIFGKEKVYTTYTNRFLGEDMQFEAVLKPDQSGIWTINEDGFQAAAIEVNGEIIIMYPGSQELVSDWLQTDIAPNLLHKVPAQYKKASDFAAQVKAAYPDKNIILCGHSLAGGSVEYAGSENNINSFYIDPAPGVVNAQNKYYNKGIGVIPRGINSGILNQIVRDKNGYNKTDTDIDILDIASIHSSAISLASEYSLANDNPAINETAILNISSERKDNDDVNNPGIQDHYKNYGGDHLLGTIDDDYKYAYVPLK